MLFIFEFVKSYIVVGFDCQYLEVEGDGQYFIVVIVVEVFVGKCLIQCYQLVYVVLGDCMCEEIYVLLMKILIFEEFQK